MSLQQLPKLPKKPGKLSSKIGVSVRLMKIAKKIANTTPSAKETKSAMGKKVRAAKASITRNSTATFQTVGQGNDEFFFGGGMQNGYMEHSGKRIGIWEGGPHVWDKGGHANPVPFALSSHGYYAPHSCGRQPAAVAAKDLGGGRMSQTCEWVVEEADCLNLRYKSFCES